MQTINDTSVNNILAVKEAKLWDLIDRLRVDSQNSYQLQFQSGSKTFFIQLSPEGIITEEEEDAWMILDNYSERLEDTINVSSIDGVISNEYYFTEVNGDLDWIKK